VSRYARPLAVAFLSASTLAYEILLVRIFAIEQFHHFAYMAISIAMLGFGTSGTLLALLRPGPQSSQRWFVWTALTTPPALIASVALVHLIPLDPTQLPWDPWQWTRLAVVYVLLALPFGVAALAILLAIMLEQDRPGRVYGASFLGAGLGAAIGVAVLWIAFPVKAVAVPAIVGALGSLSATSGGVRRSRPHAAAWVMLILASFVIARPVWTPDITPYKGLPQVEAFPGARRVAESTSPLGWVVAVDAMAFRHAPGLSLAYQGSFPRQTALFVDAELAGALSSWETERDREILYWLPSAMPYALGGRDRVLVLGAGGGTEVWSALAHGARRVSAVELNPELARVGGWQDGSPAQQQARGGVEWVIGDGRSFVARTDERYDLITIGAGRAFGTSAGGVHALNEDFLHTVEAYVRYLELLGADGVLAITRWVTVPPRENVRVILTAAEALKRFAPDALGDGLVVMRSWATGTVLVRPGGFSEEDVAALASWAADRRFDLDWFPGISAPGSQYNVLDEPVLFNAAAAAMAGGDSLARFTSEYAFEVAPTNDARPYPHHFLRAGSMSEFLRRDRGSWLAFAEWGYITLAATLVQSVALAGLLMIVPVLIRARASTARGRGRLVGYFAAIGFAYLTAEIAAIQQLGLLLGHPVYAVAAVLAAFLICSGVGSAWSDRLPMERTWRWAAVLAGMLIIYAAALLSIVHLLQAGHMSVRVIAGFLMMAPLALLMGLPFPLGLRSISRAGTEGIAWAWAANGFASVVATPLAALIALEAGSRALFLAAALAYACAAALGLGWRGRVQKEVA
jgi:hypothetical protein